MIRKTRTGCSTKRTLSKWGKKRNKNGTGAFISNNVILSRNCGLNEPMWCLCVERLMNAGLCSSRYIKVTRLKSPLHAVPHSQPHSEDDSFHTCAFAYEELWMHRRLLLADGGLGLSQRTVIVNNPPAPPQTVGAGEKDFKRVLCDLWMILQSSSSAVPKETSKCYILKMSVPTGLEEGGVCVPSHAQVCDLLP